jgi:putative SOS response-associated peptidase YedK
MCGRFTLRASANNLARAFQITAMPNVERRFNIAPPQMVLSLHRTPVGREIRSLEWGLIPSWMKNTLMTGRLINARSETILEKPAFREAFKRRRCLVLADGFYEWQRIGRRKRPYFFSMRDNRPFAFAGLWERWKTESGKVIESCAILTTSANEIISPVHERMPVIIHPNNYEIWLENSMSRHLLLMDLLKPYLGGDIVTHPVSLLINSPTHEGAALIEPLQVGLT